MQELEATLNPYDMGYIQALKWALRQADQDGRIEWSEVRTHLIEKIKRIEHDEVAR